MAKPCTAQQWCLWEGGMGGGGGGGGGEGGEGGGGEGGGEAVLKSHVTG